MKKKYFIFFILITAWFLEARPVRAFSLPLIQSIALPHVEGRIDHLAIDLKNQRLFVAAFGNNSLEVVDLKAGQWIHSIPGLHEPQGVLFVPELNHIFVTNGESGTLDIFDGTTFQRIQTVTVGSDADNIRYDSKKRLIDVGYGHGAIGIFNAIDGKPLGSILLEGHPEAFELEKSGTKIFINVPSAKQIAVADGSQRGMGATWSTAPEFENFPMALDETHHRLFIGFRRPAKLVVFDTESGKKVASLDCVGDADDIFYDGQHSRIYVSGGEGFLQVFDQIDAEHYFPSLKISTAPGARTSLFVPEINRLFLAVPQRGSQGTMINIYDPRP